MIIKRIEITRHKITLQGELKLVDGELSKHRHGRNYKSSS